MSIAAIHPGLGLLGLAVLGGCIAASAFSAEPPPGIRPPPPPQAVQTVTLHGCIAPPDRSGSNPVQK